MASALTDRDILTRTMRLLDGYCCDFFACPGSGCKPVPMASCARATAAYELRNYLQRHGGWCPEHGQDLAGCHPPAERPNELGYSPAHRHGVCYCAPVRRNARNRKISGQEK
jgi:hypothetical protein